MRAAIQHQEQLDVQGSDESGEFSQRDRCPWQPLGLLTTVKPPALRGRYDIMQQGIGGTVGLAMMTTLLERRTAYHASMLAQQQVSAPMEWGEILAPVRTLIQHAGDVGELLDLKALALLQRHLVQEATIAAYQDCFVVVTALCVVVMPLVLFLRRQSAE